MVSRDREWDFIFWDDTDYGDSWVSDIPKEKSSGTAVED